MLSPLEYWDHYHSERAKTADASVQPNAFLRERLSRLHRGKTLEIAMGDGQDALFLAQHGHQVVGFDLSQVAVDRALQRAKALDLKVEFKRADLDLYLFGLMEYDNIVMIDFRPSVIRYYSEMVRALKQGGMLLIEGELVQGQKEPIPRGEEFRDTYFRSNEILRQLKDMRILFYNEEKQGDRYLVQCLAQKPLDQDAVKYNLFDMHAKEEKNEKSSHMQMAENLFKK